jgi:hypothetical protein
MERSASASGGAFGVTEMTDRSTRQPPRPPRREKEPPIMTMLVIGAVLLGLCWWAFEQMNAYDKLQTCALSGRRDCSKVVGP